jgi:hypothetical protein
VVVGSLSLMDRRKKNTIGPNIGPIAEVVDRPGFYKKSEPHRFSQPVATIIMSTIAYAKALGLVGSGLLTGNITPS